MRLINGTLHTVENGTIERGYIEIRDGRIRELGSMEQLAPKSGDRDLQGAHVLPGFVDAHTCLGLKEDSMRYEGNDWNEPNMPIGSHLCAWDGFNPEDRAVQYALQGGVTAVAVASGNVNLVPGQVSAVKLCKDRPDEMLMDYCCALKIALGDASKNGRTGPGTRMAQMTMLRGLFDEARTVMDNARIPARLAAPAAALRGEIPIYVHAQRADDIVAAVEFGKTYGIRTVIVHGADAALVADHLRGGVGLVIGSLLVTPHSYETRNMDLDLPAKLEAAGLDFAITTDHHQAPVQLLNMSAALAIRDGLSREAALRAITLEPARIMGVDERIGSLKAGKDADLLIFSGEPFRCQSRLLEVYINGRKMAL